MNLFNSRTKETYRFLYIVSHISFLAYCYFFGFWYIIISLLIGLAVYNVAAELFMHRAIAHKQFKFNSTTTRFFCLLFSMCNFGSIAVNAATHINHHKFLDTDKDPHNFRNIGIFNVIIKNWNKEHSPNKRLVCSFLKDQELKGQHNNHLKYAWIAVLFLPFIPVSAFWLVNLLFIISHLNNDENDSPINIRILYPLMWGAEMHRDHHNNPNIRKMHNYDLIYYIGNSLQG